MLVQAWCYQDMQAYSQKLLTYISTSVKGKQVSNYIAHMTNVLSPAYASWETVNAW